MTGLYMADRDYLAANDAFEEARFAEAVNLYTKVSDRYPDEPEVKRQLGLSAFEHALQRMDADKSSPEDWRKAIRFLEEALKAEGNGKLSRSLAVAHHNLGVYLNEREAYEEAEGHFERALALEPGMTEASVSLAINYSHRGLMAKAEEILRVVVGDSPKALRARHTLGLVLTAQGRDEEAIEQFKLAQPPERDNVSIHYNLGVSYSSQGQLDLAEDAFRQTLELDPEFIPALYNLGLVLREKGDLPGAERCFEEVIRFDPASPGGYFCLASLYERRDVEAAVPVWERYLELASAIPSEAETVAKVTYHVAALKKHLEDTTDQK